ncbi:MAG: hypothetical protein H0V22_04680 [Solirubrobacterales bacterium]|nr:hypothetical protein [Solirubrobacterales bacterium]
MYDADVDAGRTTMLLGRNEKQRVRPSAERPAGTRSSDPASTTDRACRTRVAPGQRLAPDRLRTKGAERPEFPRAAADVAAVTSADESTRWYVVRSDFPMEAWLRIRDRDAEEPAEARGTEIVDALLGDTAVRRYVSPAAPSSR